MDEWVHESIFRTACCGEPHGSTVPRSAWHEALLTETREFVSLAVDGLVFVGCQAGGAPGLHYLLTRYRHGMGPYPGAP
jgi:hypothetical protein